MRTDIHRPGAIVPSNYSWIEVYDIGGSDPRYDPPHGIDRVRKIEAETTAAKFGAIGRCGVCGAAFRYGALWLHQPTGELVHMGRECAAKYALVAQSPEFDAHLEAVKRNRKARIEAERRRIRREAYLESAATEVAAALQMDHPILRDMLEKVGRYDLSEKQIQFALKLAEQMRNPPPPKPEEKHVNAPEGRATFRGTVVGLKVHESFYGDVMKMTVKVADGDGVWLAWGTIPRGLQVNRGDVVELKATLTRSDDKAHFAFFKRPTNATIVGRATR